MSISPPSAAGPECPWYALAELGPPNIKWCEERLCAWINEPANAWSNLAFVIVALMISWLARGRPAASDTLRRFAPTVALVGVCSFVFHASNTYVTQLLDYVAIAAARAGRRILGGVACAGRRLAAASDDRRQARRGRVRRAVLAALAGRARRDGEAAVARALYQIALEDYQQYASGSSSSAEGMGRMLAVNRVRELLGEEVEA